MISLNIEKTFGFISKEKVFAYEAEVKAAQEMLEKGTGKGNDFLGWLHLPSSITKEHLADLNATAKVLRDNCEVVAGKRDLKCPVPVPLDMAAVTATMRSSSLASRQRVSPKTSV